MADENRLKILKMLYAGEMCVCDITENLKLSQPTVSHHMKVLEDAGFVICKKSGKWSHYVLNQEALDGLHDMMKEQIYVTEEYKKSSC